MIEFTDGVKFDTSGEYRIESRYDGLYLVGRGSLIPVRDVEEARELMARLNRRIAGRKDISPKSA
jgi:hypothetical protein